MSTTIFNVEGIPLHATAYLPVFATSLNSTANYKTEHRFFSELNETTKCAQKCAPICIGFSDEYSGAEMCRLRTRLSMDADLQIRRILFL